MKQKRSVKVKMEEQSSYQMLRDSLWVTLSAVNAREESPLGVGSPYAVPMSLIEHEGQFFFHCSKKGYKTDNFKKDNRVCITCVDRVKADEETLSILYESVSAFATVEEVTEREKKILVLKALCKKYAPSRDTEKIIESEADSTAIWELHILSITGKKRKFE